MINPHTTATPDFPVYFAIPGDINTLTGGYRYDRELIKALTRQGFAIEVLTLSGEFPNPGATALAEAADIFRRLPSGAMVIADGLAFGVLNEIAERESQRLIIIALCHHPLALETGISRQVSQRLKVSEMHALAAARSVIVTSAMTGKILVQDFAVPQQKITLACPGTDRSLSFAPCHNETPQILTLATLTKRKAHDLLINALASLAHLQWHARFVGGMAFDPLWAAYLQNLVREKNLQERITFVGNVDDVSNEFRRADLFVLPSHFEGYGMAFAEALAFGLPIVAANTGAAPDLVPANAGVLIPPGDLDSLTNALAHLVANNENRRQLQAGAQSAAQTLPTWDDCANSVANLIFNLRKL